MEACRYGVYLSFAESTRKLTRPTMRFATSEQVRRVRLRGSLIWQNPLTWVLAAHLLA